MRVFDRCLASLFLFVAEMGGLGRAVLLLRRGRCGGRGDCMFLFCCCGRGHVFIWLLWRVRVSVVHWRGGVFLLVFLLWQGRVVGFFLLWRGTGCLGSFCGWPHPPLRLQHPAANQKIQNMSLELAAI